MHNLPSNQQLSATPTRRTQPQDKWNGLIPEHLWALKLWQTACFPLSADYLIAIGVSRKGAASRESWDRNFKGHVLDCLWVP